MALALIDGFDLCDTLGARLKYYGYAADFIQASMVAGRPGPSASGQNGQALYLFNTAFGSAQFPYIWPSGDQAVVGFHMDWRIQSIPGNLTTTPIGTAMRWLDLSNPTDGLICSLATSASGTLRLLNSSGLNIGSTDPAHPFYFDTWYTLEARLTFGVAAGWSVRVNQQTVMQSPSSVDNRRPDRIAFRWQGFGPPGLMLDNYVVWDGQTTGDGITDFLGPCRVTALWPTSDLNQVWVPHPGPTRYEMLGDLPFSEPGHPIDANGSPDGDDSYVRSAANPLLLNMSQSYDRLISPCFGKNIAVAINAVARPISTGQQLQAVCKPINITYVLGLLGISQFPGTRFTGTDRPALQNYANYQQITGISPATMDVWTDAEIQSAAWGFGIGSTDNINVTQAYLEKLTSLLPQRYTCGGGNYSYAVG